MDQQIQAMAMAYQGMAAEEIFADMQAQGAEALFVDAWMVANYLAHLASA
jgi:hypothetical protein